MSRSYISTSLVSITFLLLSSVFLPCFASTEDSQLLREKQIFEQGVLFLNQGKYSESANEFTKLIDKHPDMADAYKNRGAAYMKLGLYPLAISDFEKALLLDENVMGLHSNLGVAYFYQKQYQKAILHYDHEIKKIPNSYFAYFNRAICRSELGNLKQSLADVNAALEIKPDLYQAICFKGDTLAKMNNIPEAKKTYQEAIKLAPDQEYAREKLAQIQPVSKQNTPKNIQKKTSNIKKHLPQKKKPPKVLELYELQAGAYDKKENAEEICETLKDLGYITRIIKKNMPNGAILYTVRTGKFLSREDAEKEVKQFNKKTGLKAHTIRISL